MSWFEKDCFAGGSNLVASDFRFQVLTVCSATLIFVVWGTVISRAQSAVPGYTVAPGQDVDVSATLADGVLGRLVDPATCRSQGPAFPLRAWPRETKEAC